MTVAEVGRGLEENRFYVFPRVRLVGGAAILDYDCRGIPFSGTCGSRCACAEKSVEGTAICSDMHWSTRESGELSRTALNGGGCTHCL